MPVNSHTGATVLTDDSERLRLSIALHPLRRSVHRLIADFERMFDALSNREGRAWVQHVGEALVNARHLDAMISNAQHAHSGSTSQRLATLGARMRQPQQRIVDALTSLAESVAGNPEEELFLLDARAARDAAAALTLIGSGPHLVVAPPLAVPTASDARMPAHILVAADDVQIRAVLTRYLKRLGHRVTEVADGEAALEALRGTTFDLVLTDMQMPRRDGLSLLTEIKRAEATRSLPVIVLSGQDDSARVVECLRAGADDYIGKPYEYSVLEARVRASVDRKRLHDLEQGFRARVGRLTMAAEAVERQTYASHMLAEVTADHDELGRLARVFDRMVNGLRSREERLQRRVNELRREMSAATDGGVRKGDASEGEPTHFRTGETLARRYEILGTLGSGGMGTVYRVHDLELGEQIAIKVVRPDIIRSDPSIVERLKSEIRLARKITHPNVVRAHDLGEWNGTYFISMEYVHGITVADLLDRRGRLSVESTLAIGTQIAQALAVAHDAEIVHRDVKPANLLIDENGTLKVMDFGIAFHAQRTKSITLGGFVVGTPHYMAPEQLAGGALGARTDLFAVGVVLYECLAGRPPFDADSPTSLMAQIMSGSAVPLADRVPGIPPGLALLVQQLLEFEPQRRPESARALAARLAEIEPPPESDAPPIIPDLDLLQVPL